MTYQREEVFTTSIGLIVSLMSLAFLGLVAYTRTVKLLTGEDPLFQMAIEPYESATIDLWELGFMFAVENMDPKVGRVEVN